MPLFEYQAINAQGKTINGYLQANNRNDLREKLRRDGMFLSDAKESKAKDEKSVPGNVKIKLGGGKPKTGDIALMTRQLSTLISSGIPLVESIQALSEQVENLNLKKALSDIKEKVNEGSSMADAMQPHVPNTFDKLYVNMIGAGEVSGAFDLVLNRLADYTENQDKLKGKVSSALAYPIAMVCIAFLAVIVIFTFIIPKLITLFNDLEQALPLPTQILIALSNIFTSYWYIALGVIVVTVFGIRKYLSTYKGRYNYHRFLLNMPLFGKLFRMVSISRFASTLSTLLSSGVPILTAMDIVKNVINNLVLTEVIDKVRNNLREGDSISVPLKNSGEFPPMVTHMISVGEKTGELEGMLAKISQTYEMQVDRAVSTITSLIEPLMMLVLMLGIGFIVLAVMLPMFNMNQAMG
ncbi:type II secretion system inner membrane protein GspF [bacterium]|nr:type II secretion system inner membrane protein GspF [bacterium]